MKKIQSRQLFLLLIGLTVASTALYAGYSRVTHKTYFDFLVWNLFLAWIPFAASSIMAAWDRRSPGGSTGAVILLGGLWLLFFPNSPYIVTDLIHLTVLKQAYAAQGRLTFSYWYDLLLILMFAWTGLILGFASTYQVQGVIGRRMGRLMSWLFVAVSSCLGGYGVLLGREYRLNSWDVLTDPRRLLAVLKESINLHAGVFCLLFGAWIAFVYVTLYVFIRVGARQGGTR